MASRNCFLMLMALALPGMLMAQGAPDLNLDYERFTLDNGLRVIVHTDRKAPVVAVSVWYHVGSKNEPPGKTGFAHLFEHLMFNGSENYDGEWFEPLQRVGATSLNGTTWLDRTNYFQTVPTPALDLALWMESDRMGHLLGAVTQEKLDNQRGVVQNEKRQGDNQPYGRVNYNLYEGLFPPGHPYRHSTIGSMEDLDAASLEDVQQWFRDYYGPNNAVLVLAGDIDLETAREKVSRYFGDIAAGPEVDAINTWVPTRHTNTSETQYDEVPGIMANRAWVAPPRSTRERALLDLAAAVLGRGRNSRLYRDLIYEKQVASTASVGLVPFELASVFDLTVILNPGEPLAVANEAIDRIIAEFLRDGPTPDELERVVTNINASTVRGLEQVGGFSGKAAQLAEGELYAGDPLFIQQYLEWINAATVDEVLAVARQWIGDGWHQVNVQPAGRYGVAAQGVDRSGGLPPLPDDLPSLSFPPLQSATLSNGLEVVVAERPELPLVSLYLDFDAGYAADASGKQGVASFAAAMLDKGTTSRDALGIADTLERLGAIVNAGANVDANFITLSALKDNLLASLEIWADIVRNPAFAAEEVERLRGQRLTAIAQEKAQPAGLAQRLITPLLYGEGHAYAVPFSGTGSEQSVASLERDDLLDFQQAWLRPDNARLFVVGDTRLEEIVPLLESVLGGWQAPATAIPGKNITAVSLPEQTRLILVHKPGSPQSYILGAHLVPGMGDDRELALQASNSLLGGAFTSRINMNLREDKGWSYGARTTLQAAKGQRPFLVTAPVQSDRTGDSLAELLRELRDIRRERPISGEEMELAIAGLARVLPGQFETSQAVLNSLVTSARYGRPLDYPAYLAEAYEALELDDLQQAMAALLDPQRLIWIVVGDVDTIRPQVEPLGIAPLEIWNEDGSPLAP